MKARRPRTDRAAEIALRSSDKRSLPIEPDMAGAGVQMDAGDPVVDAVEADGVGPPAQASATGVGYLDRGLAHGGSMPVQRYQGMREVEGAEAPQAMKEVDVAEAIGIARSVRHGVADDAGGHRSTAGRVLQEAAIAQAEARAM